ncbi:MAG: hypothetical protein V7754_20940 [Halioglobus sp.]
MRQLNYEDVAVGESLGALQLDISSTDVIAGAMASRDYSPLHHDYHYVTEEAGHRDIFLNTPHQAALLEKYLSDWSGPGGRLGRMRFTMKASIYAGDSIILDGEVVDKSVDASGCSWLKLKLWIEVKGETATACEVRYALPGKAQDSPWKRKGEAWQP